MFKVGDKVRILTPGYDKAEGTIVNIFPGTPYPFRVDSHEGDLWVFKKNELELVEEPRFKMGDRVSTVRGPYHSIPSEGVVTWVGPYGCMVGDSLAYGDNDHISGPQKFHLYFKTDKIDLIEPEEEFNISEMYDKLQVPLMLDGEQVKIVIGDKTYALSVTEVNPLDEYSSEWVLLADMDNESDEYYYETYDEYGDRVYD